MKSTVNLSESVRGLKLEKLEKLGNRGCLDAEMSGF